MNNSYLFELLKSSIYETRNEPFVDRRSLDEELYELANRQRSRVVKSPVLPRSAEAAIPILREHYRNDVNRISLVLSHKWSDQFIFYRTNRFDEEIFAGLEYFANLFPEFDLPFNSIRRNAFDDYLELNNRLFTVFRRGYDQQAYPLPDSIYRLIYWIFPKLFVETTDYDRYWINATNRSLDDRQTTEWSGRKQMQNGDLVFMYEMAPVKGIRSLWEVDGDTTIDPFAAWDGVWVNLNRLADFEPISFREMRNDDLLRQWSVIRRQFQGVVTESVPHAFYNRLVELLPESVRAECELEPEPTSDVGTSGKYASENDFEDDVVEPLIRSWGFSFQRQFPVKCYFGTQQVRGYIDFLIFQQGKPATLFENKLQISSDKHLELAVNQAKSYALMLGLSGFIVGSPEGFKVFELDGAQERLVFETTLGSKNADDKFRAVVAALR